MAKRTKKPKRDIYQEITDKVIELLDRGVVPWKRPIKGSGKSWFPKNHSTGKDYRGFNIFWLDMVRYSVGYDQPQWLTFKQCQAMGGQVRKGEKSTFVTFFKFYEKEDKETGDVTRLPCLRTYNVFNVEQCDGLEYETDDEAELIQFDPIEKADQIIAGYQNGPEIIHVGRQASYSPSRDQIKIAKPERFASVPEFYSTLFHELAHSTGHEKRLNRSDLKDDAVFGSSEYAKEELTGELCAAFLSAHAGISDATIENSAAYLDGWIKRLKSDKRLLVQAGGQAQRAADHILGITFEEAAGEVSESEPKTENQPPADKAPNLPAEANEAKPAPQSQLGFDFA